jgi:hypothetical protein
MFIVAAVGLDTVFRGVSADLLREWYVDPTKEMLRSPSEFFRTTAVRRTPSDMYGYLFVSIGVTAVLTNFVAFVVGLGPVQSALDLDLSGFKLVLEGGWPETVAQVYLFLLLIAVVSFAVIEASFAVLDFVLKRQGAFAKAEDSSDYESTLAAACYSMAFAPLLSIPIVTYGFDIFFVGSELVSSLIVAVPVFIGMLWLMYVGTTELQELSRTKALATMGGLVLAWLLISGVIALSLGTL